MRYFPTLLCLIFPLSLWSQDLRIVSGKVLDATTGRPIAFAHVGIPERGIGTTTADDGSFVFKVPEQYAHSTLMVSFIGYKTYEKALSEVHSPVTIKIRPMPTNLKEIVIMDEGHIENIIRKAVRNIPKNYPDHPTTALGFYRETRTNADKEYVYMAEGVLNIYKTAYASKKGKEGQTSLVQGRQVRLLPPEEFSKFANFTSGHMAAHRFDFVKNLEDFIDESHFEDYRYRLEGITTFQDLPVYIIGFEGEPGHARGRLRGTVYIDTSAYAFVRAEFEVTPEGLKKYNDYPLYSGPWKANKYVVNYRKTGQKWYFGDALREGVYRDGGLYSNEILITQINPGKGHPLPYQERLERSDRFLDVTGEYDENFWADYNTTPLNAALRNSLQQEKNTRKADQLFDPAFMAELKRQQDSIEQENLRQSMAETDRSDILTAPEKAERWERRQKRKAESKWRLTGNFGAGAHLLYTNPQTMKLTWLTKDDGQPVISTEATVGPRNLEVVAHWGFDVFFGKHAFARIGWAGDFWNSIYEQSHQGIGLQVNLIKRRRPFYVRVIGGHSRLRYARKIGQATNEFGKFKAGKKKFKAEKINMYYGSRTHYVEGTLELAVEANRHLEIFARGTWQKAFAEQSHIYLWERREIFRKKARIPLNDQTEVLQNGVPFRGSIIERNPLFFSVGVIFK